MHDKMTLNYCNKEVTWKKIISRRLSERIKKVTKTSVGIDEIATSWPS